MNRDQTTLTTSTLPVTTSIGTVYLRVADLETSLGFYRDVLGFQAVDLDPATVALETADGARLVVLQEQAGLTRPPRRSSGLYHLAILMPTRRDLAAIIQQLVARRYPIGGASDHGVSEAFYLDDPEGNGIEIYADRPKETWPMAGAQVQMGSDQINLESLFAELEDHSAPWGTMPAGTTIGHVHLKVGDMAASRTFYTEVLGFDVMQENYPGALFVAAGGYHHHIGMNTWTSRGIDAPPEDTTGLDRYSVRVPSKDDLDAIAERLAELGQEVSSPADGILQVTDPNGIRVEFEATNQ